jgi:hypothetical protein
MPEQKRIDAQEPKLVRLEALSDGVFSVALTLLLLEIRPKGAEIEITSDAWWHQVFLNSGLFAASFFLVGIYWVAHKNECQYLKRTDRFADWLNLVFLAAVALLPFSVSVLAESWHSSAHAVPDESWYPSALLARAVSLYLGNVASAGVALNLFFLYITMRGWLNEKGMEHRRFTVLKNAALPLLCVTAWGCFKLNPQMVLRNFLSFMAFPPAVYLGFTLSIAVYVSLRRWLRSP